jgi:uncharacterized protein YggE
MSKLTPTRLAVPLALLAVALAAGACTTASAASPVAQTTATPGADSTVLGAPALGAPAVGIARTGVATTNAAIAYPYFVGSPGVAPDHTIVVTGVGQATAKADLSDQAAARDKALAAAVADAKSQADTAARLTGTTISGVLSVAVSDNTGYAMPMAVSGGAVEGSAGSTTASPIPPIAPPISVPAPDTTQLTVSVTIAYTIGG